MKNMKNLNRELIMEELEGVIGGVEPELDLAETSEESTIDKLKYMIADRADVVVSQIFEGYMDMTGAVILLGGVLYSIQLYADFLACVTISQGVAEFFGIKLRDNFAHPYFAPTVQDFWRRWHMSLSFWLRDYVYIPLGGNRKGKIRKYINLILTFLVSGFWHGGLALNFIFWGLLHAFYQVVG